MEGQFGMKSFNSEAEGNKTKQIDYSSLDLDVICFVLFLTLRRKVTILIEYRKWSLNQTSAHRVYYGKDYEDISFKQVSYVNYSNFC